MFKRIALIACCCALTTLPLFAVSTPANGDQNSQPTTSGTHSKPSLFHRIWPFDRHKPKTKNLGAPRNSGTEIIKSVPAKESHSIWPFGRHESKSKKTDATKTARKPIASKKSSTEIIKVVPTTDVKRSEKLMKSVRESEERQKKNERHSAIANRETEKMPSMPKRDMRRGAVETQKIVKTETDNSVIEPTPKTANHEKKIAKHSAGFSAPISFVPDSAASTEAPKGNDSFGTKLVEDETKDRSHYETLKAKALTDEKIQKLKTKADSALTDQEGRVATKAYYRALFSKIHRLNHQSSFDAYIDRMQTALTKRLDNQKI